MMLSRVQNYIGTFVNDYTFVIILYSLVLFAASHTQLFWWTLLATTPLVSAAIGYGLKAHLDEQDISYGFQILSDSMTWEMHENHTATLRYKRKLRATSNHMLTYPIGYQWTGSGKGTIPEIKGDGQRLLGVVRVNGTEHDAHVAPYAEHASGERDWNYWFIAFNPPLNYGDVADVEYSQAFTDKKGEALPCVFYSVKAPVDRLELNVKFPSTKLPKTVTCSYTKPSDPRHTIASKGVVYDPQKQWATWVIDHPKKGFSYQITWK